MPKFLARAAAHVRAGGFSVIVQPDRSLRVLLPRRSGGGLLPFAKWALLAIGVRRFGVRRSGLAKGLAVVRVRRADEPILREWCERDSVHPDSTHRLSLDCAACAACCRDNRVVLEPRDFARFRRAGRPDLGERPYVRSTRGVRLLVLSDAGRCAHLEPTGACAIYELRPDNCRAFLEASEACLAARLETLGLVD